MKNIEKTDATYNGKKLSLIKCPDNTCDGCFFSDPDNRTQWCATIEEIKGVDCQGFIFAEQKEEGEEPLSSLETYIDILFMYNKEFYVERIFTSEIDNSQSECIWTHWFKNLPEDNNPNLTFEIVGDKDEEGNLTTENMYILVYADQDDDDPEAICVDEINFRKSWCNHKAFR